jgi:hypothetical protein
MANKHGANCIVTTGYPISKQVIGGSLQYPSSVGFGFMPVIVIASELDSNA